MIVSVSLFNLYNKLAIESLDAYFSSTYSKTGMIQRLLAWPWGRMTCKFVELSILKKEIESLVDASDKSWIIYRLLKKSYSLIYLFIGSNLPTSFISTISGY